MVFAIERVSAIAIIRYVNGFSSLHFLNILLKCNFVASVLKNLIFISPSIPNLSGEVLKGIFNS